MSDLFNDIAQWGREKFGSSRNYAQDSMSDVQETLASTGADAETISLVKQYLSSLSRYADAGSNSEAARQAIINHISKLVKQSVAANGMTGSMFTKEQARAGANGINFETYLQALAPYPVEEWYVGPSYPLPAPKGTKRMGGTPPDALRKYSNTVVPYSRSMSLMRSNEGARAQQQTAMNDIMQLTNEAFISPEQAAMTVDRVLSKYADLNGNLNIHGEARELLAQRLTELNRHCTTGGESSGYAVSFIGCALENGLKHTLNWLEKSGLPPDDGGNGTSTRTAILSVYKTRYKTQTVTDSRNVDTAEDIVEKNNKRNKKNP